MTADINPDDNMILNISRVIDAQTDDLLKIMLPNTENTTVAVIRELFKTLVAKPVLDYMVGTHMTDLPDMQARLLESAIGFITAILLAVIRKLVQRLLPTRE